MKKQIKIFSFCFIIKKRLINLLLSLKKTEYFLIKKF